MFLPKATRGCLLCGSGKADLKRYTPAQPGVTTSNQSSLCDSGVREQQVVGMKRQGPPGRHAGPCALGWRGGTDIYPANMLESGAPLHRH